MGILQKRIGCHKPKIGVKHGKWRFNQPKYAKMMVLSARNTRNGMWCGCLNQRICLKLDAPIYVEKSGVLNLFETTTVGFLKNLSNSGFAATEISYAEPLVSFMGHPHHSWIDRHIPWTHIQPIYAQTPKISKNTLDGYIIKYPHKLHRFLPHLSPPKKYSTNLSLGEASRSLIEFDPCLVSFKIITYGNEFSSQQKKLRILLPW